MNNISKFFLEEDIEKFEFQENKININIKFNRVAFIFFIFFFISVIYTIHLIHLGSRNIDIIKSNNFNTLNKSERADIIDRDGIYIAKTVSSIDIGINPIEIIDQKKLLVNLKYIFPKKNYKMIKSKFKEKKFFWFEKKISDENYQKIMMLGDKSIKPHEKLTRVYPQKN